MIVLVTIVLWVASTVGAVAQSVSAGSVVETYTMRNADELRVESIRLLTLPFAAEMTVGDAVLGVRGAYADAESDPREHEGVIAIDDVEMLREPAVLRTLAALLRRALPNVQWLLTTASAQLAMACAEGELVTLRRSGPTGAVEIGEGVLH